MTKQQNIQVLFRAITHESVEGYLLKHGWTAEPADVTGMLKYVGPSVDADGPPQVWIWGNRDHKRYTSRLQNAVFTLAVLENRSALDIANDIYDVACDLKAKVQETGTEKSKTNVAVASSPPPSTQIRLVNQERRNVQVELLGDQRFVNLAPQSAVLLSLTPNANASFELSFREHGIAIRGVTPGDAKLFETVQKPLNQWTSEGLKKWVQAELERFGIANGPALFDLIENLQPEFDRTAFSVTPLVRGEEPSSQRSDSLLRQAAMMISALARKLPESDGVAQVLWQVAILFGDVAQVRFPVEPELAIRLLHAARLDDPTAPVMTYTFLQSKCHVA